MPQGVALEAGTAESPRGVAAQLAAGAVLQGALVHICGDRHSQEPAAQLASHPPDSTATAPQGPQAGSLDTRTWAPAPKCTSCCWDMT